MSGRIRGAQQSLGVLIAGAVVALALLHAAHRANPATVHEVVFRDVGPRLAATVAHWSAVFLAVIAVGALLGVARVRLGKTLPGRALRGLELLARSLPIFVLALAAQMLIIFGRLPPGVPAALLLALPLGAWSARVFSGTHRTAWVALTISLIGPAVLAATVVAEPLWGWRGIGQMFGFASWSLGNVVGLIAAYTVAVALLKLAGALVPVRAVVPPRGRNVRSDWAFVLGVVLCSVLGIVAVGAQLFAPMSPNFIDIGHWQGYPLPPGVAGHTLGTDENGRDLLSRAMYGLQRSAVIAVLATLAATALGTAIAFATKRLAPVEDRAALAVTGIRSFAAFPLVAVAAGVVILTAGAKGLTPLNLALLIAAILWPAITTAARADASWRSVFATAVSVAAGALQLEATLSFMGLGVQPPAPSLGNMFVNAQSTLAMAPWIAIVPSALLIAALFALNAVGDGLRDAADDAATGISTDPSSSTG